MEVIRLPATPRTRRRNIARRYLLPKQQKGNGLKDDELKVSDPAIIGDHPPLHARGGRAQPRARAVEDLPQVGEELLLERDRKVVSVTPKNLDKYLGGEALPPTGAARGERPRRPGDGLAWTESGRELLTIESAVVPGKGKLTHTGQLGEVMQGVDPGRE